MCGIVGQIEYQDRVDLARFLAMRGRLRHRGPDGAGLYVSPGGSVALGHARLALVDLSDAGRQPMGNEDRTLWLSVNGEIYNAPLLRRELEDKGHVFSSRSDSEAVLHGFEEWGEGVLSRLSGMFALAVWDEKRRRLFLARDRFGIKPLYWAASPERFAFASELKALAVPGLFPLGVDFSAACDYFAYRYVPAPKTIWQNVHKLPPGHWMAVTDGRPGTPRRWWTLPRGEVRMPREEAAARVAELLKASCVAHLQSDVPVGAFLSGGYDSSALALCMADLSYPVRAFSIGFSGWDQSEHRFARQVASLVGGRLHERILGPESLDILSELSWVYDEPLADISTVPTYEVSRLAAGHVKAVFSGEGADELFCGYTWHRAFHERHGRPGLLSRAVGRAGLARPRPDVDFYAESMAMGRFDRPELLRLLSPDLAGFVPRDTEWFYRAHHDPGLAPVRSMQHLDIRCFMGELVLTKVDRASMAHSLEVRVPYLDPDLVDFVLSLDESVVYAPGVTKPLLRSSLEKRLPPEILARKKQGFVGPDSYYADMPWYRDRLLGGTLVGNNVVQKKTVEDYLARGDAWRLWKILVFELWYSRWAAGIPGPEPHDPAPISKVD